MEIFHSVLAQIAPYLIGGLLTALGTLCKNFGEHLSSSVQRSMAQDLLPQGGEDEKPVTSRSSAPERSEALKP